MFYYFFFVVASAVSTHANFPVSVDVAAGVRVNGEL